MDSFRTGLLRIADELTLAARNAGQSFAFLSDGRELVETLETQAGVEGCFSDRADEGWPALSFPLPRDAKFHQATSSVLTRTAVYGLLGPLDQVEEAVGNAGLRATRRGRDLTVDLGLNSSMHAREHRPNDRKVRVITTIRINQTREPDAIGAALANRGKGRTW